MLREHLSKIQARKLVLLSQGVLPGKLSKKPEKETLSVIEHLGYVQIDTISAVQRAHHHTLWNRNPQYQNSHIDYLVAEKSVFEYWSHAAAYLPMRDFRFSLLRKQAIASGKEKHWYAPDQAEMKSVLARISSEGPLMAKDFERNNEKLGEWYSKSAKRALEQLYMQGELMITKRVNFHKVYDLTERVLPQGLNVAMPTQDEFARFLIIRFLKANGLGQISEIKYLLKNSKALFDKNVNEMLSNYELMELNVDGKLYYALPFSLDLLGQRLQKSRLRILSPFDNLLIQRKRTKALFDFDYLLECYVPEAKRQYGYFALPVLWDGQLLARMDCKAERSKSILHIKHLAVESKLKKDEAFVNALVKELILFMQFNNCKQVQIHRTTPSQFEPMLKSKTEQLIF